MPAVAVELSGRERQVGHGRSALDHSN
jgi:hypothetical protein